MAENRMEDIPEEEALRRAASMRNTWIIPEDTYQYLLKWTCEAEEAKRKLAQRKIIQCMHPEKALTKRMRRRLKGRKAHD